MTANGTLAQPVATGQVSLLEGGRVTVRRARIRAQEGRVELNGYPAGVPEVDFEGLTQVGGVTMSLRAQGSMDDLQLDIRSPNRPDLSQTDLVSLLLTGRTSQAAASEGGAIVAEELAAALGGALQKGVGETFLIDVSSDAVDAARRGRPDAALQDRHAGRPGPRRLLLDPPRRHRAALGRAVEPPRRPVHASARSRTPRRGRSSRRPTG